MLKEHYADILHFVKVKFMLGRYFIRQTHKGLSLCCGYGKFKLKNPYRILYGHLVSMMYVRVKYFFHGFVLNQYTIRPE